MNYSRGVTSVSALLIICSSPSISPQFILAPRCRLYIWAKECPTSWLQVSCFSFLSFSLSITPRHGMMKPPPCFTNHSLVSIYLGFVGSLVLSRFSVAVFCSFAHCFLLKPLLHLLLTNLMTIATDGMNVFRFAGRPASLVVLVSTIGNIPAATGKLESTQLVLAMLLTTVLPTVVCSLPSTPALAGFGYFASTVDAFCSQYLPSPRTCSTVLPIDVLRELPLNPSLFVPTTSHCLSSNPQAKKYYNHESQCS